MIEVLLQNNEKKIFINNKEEDISKLLLRIDVDKELLMIMKRVENQVVNNIDITKIYLYDGIEMYNFFRGTFCVNFKDILEKYLFLYEIYDNYKDDSIRITTDNLLYKQIIESVFNRQCKFEESKAKAKNNSKNNLKFHIKLVKRLVIGSLYLGKKILHKNCNERVLFITQASDINKIEINGKTINYDSQFGYLLEKLNKDKNKDIIRMQFLNNDIVLDKADKIDNRFIPYEIFVLIKKIYSKKAFNKDKVFDSISLLKEFNWDCKGKSLAEVLQIQFFNKLESIIHSYVNEIITWRMILKKLKIKVVFATDEADRTRCAILAANEKKLRTYAIQHGIITKASTSYMIPTKKQNYVPNKTYLWGKKYKEVLLNNTHVYNKDNLVVVGQPRTDYLVKKLSEGKKAAVRKKTRILYATQYVWDLTQKATDIFIKAIKDIDDVEVIIKLHPGDKYEKYYNDIVKKYKLSNVNITKNMDIYDAIIWCDLIISVHSTVVLEGALLNKPSICILLEKYYDQGNFVKEGLSKGVTNEAELKKILIDKNYINNNLQEYVEECFYKIDGNVANRILKNTMI